MKKTLLYLAIPALIFLSCNRDKEIEPKREYPVVPEVVQKMEKFDDLANAGKYSELFNYFTTPADYDFLAGSTEDYQNNESKLTITNLKVDPSSDPSQKKIVLNAESKTSFYNPPEDNVLDWKIYLSAYGSVDSLKSWKIDKIEQSNLRINNLESMVK